MYIVYIIDEQFCTFIYMHKPHTYICLYLYLLIYYCLQDIRDLQSIVASLHVQFAHHSRKHIV